VQAREGNDVVETSGVPADMRARVSTIVTGET